MSIPIKQTGDYIVEIRSYKASGKFNLRWLQKIKK